MAEQGDPRQLRVFWFIKWNSHVRRNFTQFFYKLNGKSILDIASRSFQLRNIRVFMFFFLNSWKSTNEFIFDISII